TRAPMRRVRPSSSSSRRCYHPRPPMTPERPSDPPPASGWLRPGPFGYTDEGEGAALVALHGLPGSARDYRWLAPELEGVRLVRLEQPGFGATAVVTEPDPTLAARTEFVLDALRAMS